MQSKGEYTLGPLPWPEETLEKALNRGFTEAFRSIKEHPGYDLEERQASIKSALRLFNKSANSFFTSVEQFQVAVYEKGLLNRSMRGDLREFDERFQEILYLFACAAMTLVDQTRSINKKTGLPGYADQVSRTFSNNPLHKVVQELRNDLVHLGLYQPGWNTTQERDNTKTTRFLLGPRQLRRTKEWASLARKYVEERPEGIDVGVLIADYQSQVNEFHKWLQEAFDHVAGDMIKDYLRCDRFLNALSSRPLWQLMLSQILIQGKRDPYNYLDRYLSKVELKEVEALPHRSIQQVDRIIELVDDDGSCNTELRQLAYQAFGVSA